MPGGRATLAVETMNEDEYELRRLAKPTGRDQVYGVVGGLVALAVGAYSLFLGLHDYYLGRRGAVTQGTLLEKSERDTSRPGESRRPPEFLVRYRFSTAQGLTFEAVDSEMSSEEWRPLSVGGPITVFYHPRWPWINRPARHINWIPTIAGAAFGTLAVILGLWSILLVIRRWWKSRDLLSV